jgi:hypothetical protein
MAPVGGLPLAVLFGHLSPRRSRPRHPKYAAQDGAMVVWGLPTSPLCDGNNGRTNAHCLSVRLASSGAIVAISGGPSLPSACLAVRAAVRQRAATAWCALLHEDHPNRKRLRLFGSAIARTSLLASGTVGGIRPRSRPPFYPLLPLVLPKSARRPGRRGRAGRGLCGGARSPTS